MTGQKNNEKAFFPLQNDSCPKRKLIFNLYKRHNFDDKLNEKDISFIKALHNVIRIRLTKLDGFRFSRF